MRERKATWLAALLVVTAGALFVSVSGPAANSAALGAGQAPARIAQGVQPVLTIRSPRSGATVTAPWPVHYAIAGLTVGPNQPIRIMVALAAQPDRTMHLTARGRAGVVTVPDDRFFSGRRDVVFTLLRSNGTAYANSRASVTVSNLTIAGSR